MLPHEAESVRELWPHVRDAHNKAEALHDLVVAAFFGVHLKATKFENWDDSALPVIVGLLAKICKTHRAVELAAENGLGQDAMTLARSMYEAGMIVIFILEKDTKQRTAMYVTSMFEQRDKMFRKWETTPGTSQLAPEEVKRLKTENEIELEKWRSHCGGKDVRRHWSGEGTLEKAAELLNESQSYQLWYRLMSAHAHGGDLFDHIVPQEDSPPEAKLLPAPDHTVEALDLARSFLWAVASRIDEAWGLGVNERLKPFKPEHLEGAA